MARSPSGRPPWPRAAVASARPTSLGRVVVLTSVGVAAVALVSVVITSLASTRVSLVGNGGASEPVADASSSPTADAAVEDSPFATAPARRTGVGFLALGDRLERAVSVLGPSDRQEPDINASLTHTWGLAPGAELHVTVDGQGITGLAAGVPADPPVRIAAHAGIILGESTPAEISDRWGDDHDIARHPGEDFVLRYIECAGPFPVVIKFDQHTAAPVVHWDEPVTRVLISYADAEPGTAGCPAP